MSLRVCEGDAIFFFQFSLWFHGLATGLEASFTPLSSPTLPCSHLHLLSLCIALSLSLSLFFQTVTVLNNIFFTLLERVEWVFVICVNIGFI